MSSAAATDTMVTLSEALPGCGNIKNFGPPLLRNFSHFSKKADTDTIQLEEEKQSQVNTYPKPRLEQATAASVSVKESSQTVPQIPPTLTSKRPSRDSPLPTSRISTTANS